MVKKGTNQKTLYVKESVEKRFLRLRTSILDDTDIDIELRMERTLWDRIHCGFGLILNGMRDVFPRPPDCNCNRCQAKRVENKEYSMDCTPYYERLVASNGVTYIPVHLEGSDENIQKAVTLIHNRIGNNVDETIALSSN